MSPLRTAPIILIALALLVVLPPLVFLGSALFHSMGLDAAFAALADQYTLRRNNLAVVTFLGCLPLLLIGVLLGIRRLVRKTWQDGATYALAGALPIVLVCLFVNLEFWPSFLPSRQFMGFPHGLEFVIGPFVFAPVGACIGFVLAWIVRKRST